MPQTSFTTFPVEALQGQLADCADKTIKSYRCTEDLAAGVFVERFTDGTIRAAQGTGSGLPIAGVTVLKTAGASTAPLSTNVSHRAGDIVPVITKGSVWVAFTGGAPNPGDTLNIHHSSTVATNRGKATATAANSVAGTEIVVSTTARLDHLNTAGDLALVDLTIPS